MLLKNRRSETIGHVNINALDKQRVNKWRYKNRSNMATLMNGFVLQVATPYRENVISEEARTSAGKAAHVSYPLPVVWHVDQTNPRS